MAGGAGGWLILGARRRDNTQALARGTGTIRAIEAETPRLQRLQPSATSRAGQVDAQDVVFPPRGRLGRNHDHALAKLEGEVQALRQAGENALANHKPVGDRLDVV